MKLSEEVVIFLLALPSAGVMGVCHLKPRRSSFSFLRSPFEMLTWGLVSRSLLQVLGHMLGVHEFPSRPELVSALSVACCGEYHVS